MNGFSTNSKFTDSDLDKLIIKARKNGSEPIYVTTPGGADGYISLEISKVKKGWAEVLVDIIHCAWDVTDEGQKDFPILIERLPDPEDHKNAFCGKRVIKVEVKETGEGMMLAAILTFLGKGKYFKSIKI